MERKAPAKINLFLNVGKRREDSFHDIITIMVKINLFDDIIIEESEEIIVEAPDWLSLNENLVYKAAVNLKKYSNTHKGCKIKLKKNILPKKGLGGGSSDCANVLMGLNKLWKLNLSLSELEKLGSEIGSDVNFFLYKKSCLARGRGEIIEPIKSFIPKKNMIIIDTGIEVSTAGIYERYKGGILTSDEELDKILKNFCDGNWAKILRNDLEDTVFSLYPLLKDIKIRLINWGLLPLLCGSGSCIFALTEERKLAESVSQIIKDNFGYKVWLVNNI